MLSKIKPPVNLSRIYKDEELAAKILANGKVRMSKGDFDSPSSAAVAAIKLATGASRSVNGWDFWQVVQPGGVRVALGSFRGGSGSRDRTHE